MRLSLVGMSGVAALVAACSSSNGSGATGGAEAGSASSSQCPARDMVTLSAACVPCLTAKCNAEQSAYSGPNWASEDYSNSGGACGGWLRCIPTCGCNDAACIARCSTMMMAPECMSADMAVNSCTQQNCATECAASVNASGSGLCVAQNGSGGACPTAGLIGCCKMSTMETCVYPPLTAAEGMQICANGGTWSTTP